MLTLPIVMVFFSSEPVIKQATFSSSLISNEANLWWARAIADVDGDGIMDVVLQDNNGAGGWLGYLRGNAEGKPWEKVIVAEESPNGKKFAAGDLVDGDIDGDGDTDLIGVQHPGEWTEAGAEAIIFWYEQSGNKWEPHKVGTIPSALKDIALSDLNGDGSPEIITVTYNAETLSVFSRSCDNAFEKAWDLKIDNLHEGMDIGDVNGDGLPDIAANGYWLPNPGSLTDPWEVKTIDERWYNEEEEHWSRNATKVVCRDVDADGMSEVFISHSEKAGYPVMKYDWQNNKWMEEVVLGSLSAAHSLIVTDLDLDGAFEVLTGVNKNRAIDIEKEVGKTEVPTDFPVLILKKSNSGWSQQKISSEGVYNLLAGELEGDGDIDLVRWTSHSESDMWLLRNELK